MGGRRPDRGRIFLSDIIVSCMFKKTNQSGGDVTEISSRPRRPPAFQLLFVCLFLSIGLCLKILTHLLAAIKIPLLEGSV